MSKYWQTTVSWHFFHLSTNKKNMSFISDEHGWNKKTKMILKGIITLNKNQANMTSVLEHNSTILNMLKTSYVALIYFINHVWTETLPGSYSVTIISFHVLKGFWQDLHHPVLSDFLIWLQVTFGFSQPKLYCNTMEKIKENATRQLIVIPKRLCRLFWKVKSHWNKCMGYQGKYFEDD